jgi:hypothetical protein
MLLERRRTGGPRRIRPADPAIQESPMPRIQSFIRTRDDARTVLAAHKRHGSTPHFACPYCIRGAGARVNRAR